MSDLEYELSHLTTPNVGTRLLGATISRRLDDGTVLDCRIVETEAYDETDKASHSYRGVTKRNQVMFGPAGRAYVYQIYGLYYCLNVVCGVSNKGNAVLIRAVEPLNLLKKATHPASDIVKQDVGQFNGPAKLCRSLAIDLRLNGHDLSKWPLKLTLNDQLSINEIIFTQRIGLKDEDPLSVLRTYIKDNSYVSKIVKI